MEMENDNDKIQRRMKRNRESAAKSRLSKKMYVEQLENSIKSLQNTIKELSEENAMLRIQLEGGETITDLIHCDDFDFDFGMDVMNK